MEYLLKSIPYAVRTHVSAVLISTVMRAKMLVMNVVSIVHSLRSSKTLPLVAVVSAIFVTSLLIPTPTFSNINPPEIAAALHPFILAKETQRVYGFPEIDTVEIPVVRSYYSQITVYNSVPWQTDGDPWTTAAGTRARDGVIAANCLPFGTKIRMPDLFGDKIFVVEDRLAPRKSCFILDVWQEYSPHSKSFGAPLTRVEILGPLSQ